MSIKEKALELHGKGYNCAQSVLCACDEYTGLDETTALAIAGGFGQGVRCGEVCGCVAGAVMAIGMAEAGVGAEIAETKAKLSAMTKSFTSTFSDNYGCIRCQDLKKAGFSCPSLIAYSAELAEKIIKEDK